ADQAMDFVAAIRRHRHVVSVHPSRRHLDVFEELCRRTRATGNLVPDAYLAAIALETGSTIASADSDFRSFAGVRWINPLSRSAKKA
ncbi:MAG TPA: PIN domain-containing protein, partial [Actinomycetota bacterium]|nr:PIN domain-containing protein [Actinomycetota bacterium]